MRSATSILQADLAILARILCVCVVKLVRANLASTHGAKMQERGVPDQLHVVSGVARQNRSMVVEAAAKSDG